MCMYIHVYTHIYTYTPLGEGGAGWQRLHLTEGERRLVEEEFVCAGGHGAGGDGGWMEGTFASFSLHIKEAFAACNPRNVPVILRVKIDGCVCVWVGVGVRVCAVCVLHTYV